jgi:hypothetical protein
MNATFKVSKATWTEANLVGNITALMAKVNAYSYKLTSISIDGATQYTFTLTDIPSYANFNLFKAEFDALLTAGGITLDGLLWGEL